MNHLSLYAKLIFDSSAFLLLLFICTTENICLSFQPDVANINSSQVSNKNSDLIPTTRGSPPWEKLAWQTLCIYVKYYTLEEGETPVLGGKKKERQAEAMFIKVSLPCYRDRLRSPALVMRSQGQFQQPCHQSACSLYLSSPSSGSSPWVGFSLSLPRPGIHG